MNVNIEQNSVYGSSQSFYSQYNNKSGIYAIVHKSSKNQYIGSTVDLYERKVEHFRTLKLQIHHNKHLQFAYNKYGESEFDFVVLAIISCDKLIETEQKYLDMLKPRYNICQKAGSGLGRKHSFETISILSDKMKGNQNAKGKRKVKTIHSLSSIAINSSSKRTIKYPILISPDEKEWTIYPSLNTFCKKHNLTREAVRKLILGQRNQHKGWTIK